MIGAIAANMFREPGQPPLQPYDLFPSIPKPEPEVQSDDEILSVIKAFHAARKKQQGN